MNRSQHLPKRVEPSSGDQVLPSRLPSGAAVKLLVFDLDGTLVDSRRDLATAVNATLTQFSRPSLRDEQIASYIGDGASMLVRRSLEAAGECDEGLLHEAMPVFLHSYRKHMLDHTYVYPGVLDGLADLRRLAPALPMAVLTNKPVGPSRVICDALGLAPYMFANYGGNSFPTKKPHPEGLLRLMHEAGVLTRDQIRAEEAVLVGDSDVDVHTARAAGARCLGCSYGLAPEALQAARPDAVVRSAAMWVAALGLDQDAAVDMTRHT